MSINKATQATLTIKNLLFQRMKKGRKLNTNEKFLISFLIILIIAIAFNWDKFSERLKTTYNKYQQAEQPAK